MGIPLFTSATSQQKFNLNQVGDPIKRYNDQFK